jgi:hypothetical protein
MRLERDVSTYNDMLRQVADKPKPERFAGMTRAQIEASLETISASMKRPMSNVERAMLFGDRCDLRAALAQLAATEGK